MLTTEINATEIPDVYGRFAEIVGERHWKHRVASIKQEIKGRRFLERYLRAENDLTFQLEHLRQLRARYGVVPSREANNEAIYPAVAFAVQVLSIMDVASPTQGEQIKRRVHGALKNPDDMRGLRLELSAATHFVRRGHKIAWPEMSGQGTFDLLIETAGPIGLEVECKSISEDKGRKIHRREALDFYAVLWPYLGSVRTELHTGLSAVLTVPGRLPAPHSERVALAKRFAAQILEGRSASLDDASVRISDFDLSVLGSMPSTKDFGHVRAAIDDVSGTHNRETMVIGTAAGGALALTLQSAIDDSLMKAVFDTISDSAKRQLTGNRPGVFLTGFHGLSGKQLLSIAGQDNDPLQQPTSLRLAASRFLSTEGRNHVVGLGFLSRSGSIPVKDGSIDSGGTAYYFPKRESPMWDDAFSGLFSEAPSQELRKQ